MKAACEERRGARTPDSPLYGHVKQRFNHPIVGVTDAAGFALARAGVFGLFGHPILHRCTSPVGIDEPERLASVRLDFTPVDNIITHR